MSWDQAQPFLIAPAVGLLLGFERERSHARRLPAGSRTFALLSLMGVVAASISVGLIVAGAVVVGGLMMLAYQRSNADDPGTTTEVAAIVAYLLGALTWTRPALAVGLAVVVAGLLISKERLHHFARDVVTELEVEDAVKFFVVAFVVLPLLPNKQHPGWSRGCVPGRRVMHDDASFATKALLSRGSDILRVRSCARRC